jgi:hypothetical protein
MPEKDNIVCYSDLSMCLLENEYFSFVWACDVLHHLPPSDSNAFLKEICNRTDVLIIKDIDATHKFGNFMNKIHDKIINKETTYNIYPDKISALLELYGFETSYRFIPKAWYPHFIVVAIKKIL